MALGADTHTHPHRSDFKVAIKQIQHPATQLIDLWRWSIQVTALVIDVIQIYTVGTTILTIYWLHNP